MQAPRAEGTGEAAESESRRRVPLTTFPYEPPVVPVESKTKEVATNKPRKRYTITKVRESWSDIEHQRFLEAIKLFSRDWKKIEEYIGTKSVKQVRSHAQKYFLKVQKTGGADFIPPARPKRKFSSSSRRPSSEGDDSPEPSSARTPRSQATGSSSHAPQHSHSSLVLSNSSMFSHWISTNGLVPPPQGLLSLPPQPTQAAQSALATFFPIPLDNDIARLKRTQEQLLQAQGYLATAMTAATPCVISPGAPVQPPNLPKVYAFLGSLFDPASDNHVESLNSMSPLDRESAQQMLNYLAVQLHNSIASAERADLMGVHPIASGGIAMTMHTSQGPTFPTFRSDRPKLGDDLNMLQDSRPSLLQIPTMLFGPPRPRDADGMLDIPARNDPTLFPGAGEYGPK